MEKYDLKKHGVSQGLLSMFMRCRQETALWMQGLEPLRTTQGLQFGTVAHILLEKIYSKAHQPSRDEIFKAMESAEHLYLKERGGRISAEEEEFLQMTMVLLESVMPSYFVHHKKDFGKVKWAELEQKFKVASPIDGIDMVGRIDGAFWIGKELWLRENKTKSRIEEDILTDSLTFDFQNSFYNYALYQKYCAWPKGVLYDITRRPGEKQKQGESLVQFRRRVEERVQSEPEHYFLRYEISIPKVERERFIMEVTHIIKEFRDWVEGILPTYRNTSSCIQRFGPCRFLPVCANNEMNLYRKREELFPELAR